MSLLKSTTSGSRIYVGNLPQYVKNRDVEDLFYKYGVIKAVDIHSKFDPAFAFVEFEDPRDAEDAIRGRDNEKFEGNRIKVQFPRAGSNGGNQSSDRFEQRGGPGGSRPPPRGGGYTRGRGRGQPIRRSENRVLVSGLPSTGSWQDLKDHMREAGEVLYADVYKDGTAVCEFSNHDDMKWAIKYLDDSKFKSHENESGYIRIKRDASKSRSPSPKRRKSPSRSRSRSPRRRRSPSSSSRSSRSGKSRSRSPRRRSRSRSDSPRKP